MTSTTFFFIFIPLLAIILLAVNFLFAPHNPYQEKDSVFECGFHSFLGQNRTQFSISFFIFALLFLLFDLEILLVYPYVVSAHTNGIYGLVIMLIFFLALTLGFAFELGKNALKIDSKQMFTLSNNKAVSMAYISGFSYALNTNTLKRFTLNKGVLMSYILTLKFVNSRVFSSTAEKRGDSEMMSQIKEVTAKSEAFNKSALEMSNAINKKNIFNELKAKEWDKLVKHYKKYSHHLSQEDQAKAQKLIAQGDKMDNLIHLKSIAIKERKLNNFQEPIDLAEMSIKSKYTTFDQIYVLLKSTLDKKVTDGTISQPEVDVFNILSGKRNEEKKAFFNFKDNYIKSIKDGLNNDTNKTKILDKPSSSIVQKTDIASSSVDSASSKEVSSEIIDVILSILDSI